MTEQDILNCPDRKVLDEENIICNGTDEKPDNYDCPRLIAEDMCPRGYKQDNQARPNWLWDEDAEYKQGYIGRAGVLSLRAYIKHLEKENAERGVIIQILRESGDKMKDKIRILNQKLARLEKGVL